jgi:hypothetical protein
MARATKPRRAKAKRKAAPSATLSRSPGAASRALLDTEEAGPEDERSVEDPLRDWPETEAERDQWLVERNGEDREPPDS